MNITEMSEKLAQYDNAFPSNIHDALTQVDRWIFGSQQGIEIATKLYLLACDTYAQARISYETKMASELLAEKKEGTKATLIKDVVKSNCVDVHLELIKAENIKNRYSILRQTWVEKLNTYKKLKDQNSNERTVC
jgi:hypothetical protein